MRVNKLELLDEVSHRSRDYRGEKPERYNVSIEVRISKVDNRPWPNEVDVIIEAQGVDSQEEVFSHKASYAVEFDKEVPEGALGPVEVVWLLIREGTVSQLRKLGVDVSNSLPYSMK